MSSKPYEMNQKGGFSTYPSPISPFYSKESRPSSHLSRISPALVWIIVTLSAIFFISGLIHLLIRYMIKKRPSFSMIYHSNRFGDTSRSHSLQRQLQQLFRLHDSGLDQASMDGLPVFSYKDMVGSKERMQFDCAVCLCEFSLQDKLRLLPICGHGFHIDCIGTWLLSNSTCPLCRSTLLSSGLPMENPSQESMESSVESGEESGRRVVAVRLGKWRSLSGGVEGESSVGARRCYSMGSVEYVVGESKMVVALDLEECKSFSASARVPSNVASCSTLAAHNGIGR